MKASSESGLWATVISRACPAELLPGALVVSDTTVIFSPGIYCLTSLLAAVLRQRVAMPAAISRACPAELLPGALVVSDTTVIFSPGISCLTSLLAAVLRQRVAMPAANITLITSAARNQYRPR